MKPNMIMAILLVTSIASLWLARVLDSRCPDGCTVEALKAVSKSEAFNFHFEFDDEHGFPGAQLQIDDEDAARLPGPEELSFAAVPQINLTGIATEWAIVPSQDASIRVKFYEFPAAKGWKFEQKPGELSIILAKRSPRRAELALPAGYQGGLQFNSVSGNIHVASGLTLRELRMTGVSNEVRLDSIPAKTLTLKTVSGDVTVAAAGAAPALDISFESVSGDLNCKLGGAIAGLKAETVAGDVELSVPLGMGFSYKMQGMSSDFSGLPSADQATKGTAAHSGEFGEAPRAQLSFESLSGDFRLVQETAKER